MSVESNIKAIFNIDRMGKTFRACLIARSMRVFSTVAVCIAVSLITSGCTGDKPETPQPSEPEPEPQYITLVADKLNEVELGDMPQIILNENHTTEYRWYFDVSGDDILEVVSDDFNWDTNDAAGGGGTRIITFQTIAPGKATVEMALMQELPEPLEDFRDGIASQTVNYQISVS